MEVYILIECTDQNEYTERRCYSSAAPAREIVGVYDNILKANKDNGLTLDGETTVTEFIRLTENAYNGSVIKNLNKAYTKQEG